MASKYTKTGSIVLHHMIDKLFQDKNKVVWVRLSDFIYPRTALYLPSRYQRGHVRSSRQHFGRTQCCSQNISQNLNILLLAEDEAGHQTSPKFLSTMPATQEFHKQTNSTGAPPYSGSSKPTDSHGPFWPNAHSRQ
jgi:hypothetical protein